MKHCDSCNIVYEHLEKECPLCAANMKIEKLRVVMKAAPLMLEELKKIVWLCEEGYNTIVITPIAQAAIDAAEGK